MSRFFTQAQRRYLTELLLRDDMSNQQIIAACNSFAEPFDPSYATLRQYRMRLNLMPSATAVLADAAEIAQEVRLARTDERVKSLAEVAERIIDVIQREGIYRPDMRNRFRKDEIEQLRGLLDDIARETGGRKSSEVQEREQPTQVILTVIAQSLRRAYGDDADIDLPVIDVSPVDDKPPGGSDV